MKKNILNIILIFTCAIAFSQVKIQPGIKSGLNISNLSNVSRSDSKTGLQGGLFLNIKLTRFYELQPEINYSNQGATIEYRSFSNDIFNSSIITRERDLVLEYIGLNVANKFYPIKNLGFNLTVGPGLDILIKDNDTDITPIDIVFFGGVGYEFPFGLGLELRYKQGIIDVRDDFYDDYDYDDDDDDDYFDDTILNGVIQFSISYRLDFSK